MKMLNPTPEHILDILKMSVKDFQPNYIRRFSSYDTFQTTYPKKEDFFEFFSLQLNDAKAMHIGNLTLKVEYDYPTLNEGFTAYNYYDRQHLHPVFSYELLISDQTITIGIGPF